MKEMFSESERRGIIEVFRSSEPYTDAEEEVALLAGATRAAELMAARGGTLTADRIARARLIAATEPGTLASCLTNVLDAYLAQGARLAVAEARFPAEMKDCTILFVECPRGHGRLTAANWVDHGCPTCERDTLKAQVEALQSAGAVLSAHVDKTVGGDGPATHDDALVEGFETGAEAMRTACIIAVREALSNVGAWDRDTERLVTVALEGAIP